MATSSITDNVVICDPKQAEMFANAIEDAYKSPLPHKKTCVRMITDRAEFIRLMERRRELHG